MGASLAGRSSSGQRLVIQTAIATSVARRVSAPGAGHRRYVATVRRCTGRQRCLRHGGLRARQPQRHHLRARRSRCDDLGVGTIERWRQRVAWIAVAVTVHWSIGIAAASEAGKVLISWRKRRRPIRESRLLASTSSSRVSRSRTHSLVVAVRAERPHRRRRRTVRWRRWHGARLEASPLPRGGAASTGSAATTATTSVSTSRMTMSADGL